MALLRAGEGGRSHRTGWHGASRGEEAAWGPAEVQGVKE